MVPGQWKNSARLFPIDRVTYNGEQLFVKGVIAVTCHLFSVLIMHSHYRVGLYAILFEIEPSFLADLICYYFKPNKQRYMFRMSRDDAGERISPRDFVHD